ncbi:hypothetical protein SAMN06265795_103178 [Noviherbaspirillum humi]|uniref:Uncharacterized protein n=1 Tax=Noviherbaspirillum humi TaxID=1688639 RepID=A0A239F699_9BURK|nr:hypothetical protein [Noviherbaspirillum humi]SNS51823.1 hypothetical protein SAMN06265795_103178 [Noviherbaspirillum humi]
MNTSDDLLRDAYAIIDGIPADRIRFGPACAARGPSLTEGTVCAPEGWLAQHPQFQALGLSLSPDGSRLLLHGEPGLTSPAGIMAAVFGLPAYEAQQLFGERHVFAGADESGAADKQAWLQRIQDFLHAGRRRERAQTADGDADADLFPEPDEDAASPATFEEEPLSATVASSQVETIDEVRLPDPERQTMPAPRSP